MMDSIKYRTSWVINYIIKNNNLTNKKLGKALGFVEYTIASYRLGITVPKAGFISKLCRKYNIDILWFMTGEGEPFKGASSLFPEMFNKPDDYYKTPNEPYGLWSKTDNVNSDDVEYNIAVYGGDNMLTNDSSQLSGDSFEQDISCLREIYNYNDPDIIMSLHQNLKTFVSTIRREKFVSIQNNKIVDLEKRLDKIECKNTEV